MHQKSYLLYLLMDVLLNIYLQRCVIHINNSHTTPLEKHKKTCYPQEKYITITRIFKHTKYIKNELETKIGPLVDIPKPNFGTMNDGISSVISLKTIH